MFYSTDLTLGAFLDKCDTIKRGNALPIELKTTAQIFGKKLEVNIGKYTAKVDVPNIPGGSNTKRVVLTLEEPGNATEIEGRTINGQFTLTAEQQANYENPYNVIIKRWEPINDQGNSVFWVEDLNPAERISNSRSLK